MVGSKISCNKCGWRSDYRVGTLDEHHFMRVIDTTMPEEPVQVTYGNKTTRFQCPHKLFFCTPSCYLDYTFEKAVMGRAGINTLNVLKGYRDDTFDAERFEHWVEKLGPHYSDIVHYAEENHGFKQFMEREGITLRTSRARSKYRDAPWIRQERPEDSPPALSVRRIDTNTSTVITDGTAWADLDDDFEIL